MARAALSRDLKQVANVLTSGKFRSGLKAYHRMRECQQKGWKCFGVSSFEDAERLALGTAGRKAEKAFNGVKRSKSYHLQSKRL